MAFGILMESALGWDRALVIMVLNSVMLVLAYVILGKRLFFKVLFGSIVFPLAIAVVPEYMLASDRLLSVILGVRFLLLGLLFYIK